MNAELHTGEKRKWVPVVVAVVVLIVLGVWVVLHRKGVFTLPGIDTPPPGYGMWVKNGQDETGYWGENEHGMVFRYIAPGSLAIGTNRVLVVTNGYWIQTTELTQGQWDGVGLPNPSAFTNGADYPVEQVSRVDCADFARKFGRGYRLPTGDEWEYACRAGSATAYCFGDSVALLGDYAWFKANAGGTTHPVGKKKPNAWGLYDMHGNVWEWVADESQGSDVPCCGGGWSYDADYCASACRGRGVAGHRYDYLGFRLLRTTSSLNPVAGSGDAL